MFCKILTIDGQGAGMRGLDLCKAPAESHFTERAVMTKCLTVRCEMEEAGIPGEREETIEKPVAIPEQVSKCHLRTEGSMMEEDRYRFSGREAAEIGNGGIDTSQRGISPVLITDVPDPAPLVGGEERKKDAMVGKYVEGFQVDCHFRQPHSFRISPEPVLKITDAPSHFGFLVGTGEQWHDEVVVRVGKGTSMP
jgi:hypothetical protein